MENLFIVIVIILLLIIIATNIMKMRTWEKVIRVDRNSIDTDLANLVLQDNFVAKVNMLIDSIIKEHSDMYQVMVLSTNEAKAQYINTEEQDKMQQYVIHMTLKDISPELKKIIGLVYNIETAQDLKDVISKRVKLYLINFIIEYNSDIEE